MLELLRLVTEVAIASPWLLAVIVGLAAVDALLPVVPSEALILAAGVAAAAGQQDLLLVIGAAGAARATGCPPRRCCGFTLVGAWLSAAWVAVLGFLGGTAFAGNTLRALAVSFTLATVIGLGVEAARRLSAGRDGDGGVPGGA